MNSLYTISLFRFASVMFLFLGSIAARAQCDFSSDYSNPSDWTQVGSEVEVLNGQAQFLNGAKCREFQKRLLAPLGTALNEGDCWTARIEFAPLSVGVKNALPYSGHAILALTAGTKSFFFECPDPTCTGHQNGSQDGLMVMFVAYNPPDGNLYFQIASRDSTTEERSGVLEALPLGRAHYIELKKVGAQTAQLSVYSDANYSTHIPGSPVSLTYSGSIDGLTHVQHGNTIRGESRRQLTGTLDNVCVQWNKAGFERSSLPTDTTLCAADTVILDAGRGGNLTYNWNNGSTDSILQVTQPGEYIVEVTGACGSIIDTVIVRPGNPLQPQLQDLTACEGDAPVLVYSAANAKFLWSTGETTPSIRPTQSGLYSVRVETACDTIVDDAFVTLEDCSCEMKLPNVFTPNGDGNNDFFTPTDYGNLCTIHLIVYNRWGSRVYETRDPHFEWDGGSLPEGVYFWILTYGNGMSEERSDKGTVTIAR